MRNNLINLSFVAFLLLAGFGCNFSYGTSSSNDNASPTPTTPGATSSPGAKTDASPADANALAKTGVAECDEFIDMMEADMKSPDDNFVTRGIREYVVQMAKEAVKKNIEENKGDKEKIAAGCKKAKEDYVKDKEKKAAEEKK